MPLDIAVFVDKQPTTQLQEQSKGDRKRKKKKKEKKGRGKKKAISSFTLNSFG